MGLIRVEVSSLNRGCGYRTASDEQMKRGGFAASDTCQAHATSAVDDPRHPGNVYWRCDTHRGLWQGTETALVVTTVLVKEDA